MSESKGRRAQVDAAQSTPIRSETTLATSYDLIAVSPAEAARRMGIGKTFLYEAMRSGNLTSFKLGRRRLIRVADLEAWALALRDGLR